MIDGDCWRNQWQVPSSGKQPVVLCPLSSRRRRLRALNRRSVYPSSSTRIRYYVMGGNLTSPLLTPMPNPSLLRFLGFLLLFVVGRPRTQKNNADAIDRSLWLASNPSKRWAEAFFLLYTPFWLTLCLGIVVPFKLYEVLLCFSFSLFGFHDNSCCLSLMRKVSSLTMY